MLLKKSGLPALSHNLFKNHSVDFISVWQKKKLFYLILYLKKKKFLFL